jgi:hypothetical protein
MNMFSVTTLTRHGFDEELIWANSATEAIAQVRAEFGYEPVTVSVRRALYAEWDCNQTISGACSH